MKNFFFQEKINNNNTKIINKEQYKNYYIKIAFTKYLNKKYNKYNKK